MRSLVVLSLACGARALKVVDAGVATVSKALPFENKDAFFVAPPTYYGVFDGVSAGPQSRLYASTLAKTACDTLNANAQKKWPEQTQLALSKATEAAKKYNGCSTAMLLKLDVDGMQPTARIYSLGDCQTLVLRKNIFKGGRYAVAAATTAKLHPENGAPYQFGGGKKFQSDEIADGEDFNFKVSAGDILLAFTDGVGDNMKPEEIEELVCRNFEESAEELASTLVAAARERRAVDDDCTAVAVKLGDGDWVGGTMAAQTTPTDSAALQNAAQGFFKSFTSSE